MTLSSAIERALPVSRLFRSSARSPGRAWASTAAAPATTAAAGLEPLTVPKRGVPSSLAPGSEVVSATPGAARSGLTRPSKASPREENGAIPPSLPLCTTRGTPIETAGCWCAWSAASAACADAQRHADDRDVHRLVDAEPAGRELRPVDDDGGGAGAGGVLDRELRVGAAVDERRAVGDEAAAVAVEERAQARAAGPRRRELALERPVGDDGAGERQRAVEHEVEPDAHGDRDLLGVGAQVGGGDGQRGRRAARAGDAAEGRAGGAVVAGRRDHERVELQRALDRPRLRRVGEGRVRDGLADQRDPRRVVGVAVEVRVDRALEPGDQLVGARVDGRSRR